MVAVQGWIYVISSNCHKSIDVASSRLWSEKWKSLLGSRIVSVRFTLHWLS